MMRFESRHSQMLNLIGDAKSDIRSKIKAMEAARRSAAALKPAARAPEVGGRAPKPEGRMSNGGFMPVAERQPAALMHEEGIEDNIYRPPVTPIWEDAWRVTEGIITMMARETAAHHVPLLVVTLANPPQIYPAPSVRGYYLQTYGSTDIFYPDRRIEALGEREGFQVLNLAAPMQAYADEHHVFLAGFKSTKLGVGHWNADGHRLAGELIAQKICEMLSNR
jgi:hypothetical protein